MAMRDDVLIVGAGITGMVAALELLRQGRRVLMLDRDVEGLIGGQARESFGGILVVDTPLQRRHGVRDSVELALADWLRFGELTPGDGWSYQWAQAYVRDCRAQVYDWLRALGVGFLPMPQWPERRGNSVPRWHIVWGTGETLVLRLLQGLHRASDERLTLRFGHRVDRFLVEDGRVVGVAGACEFADGHGREDAGAPFEHRASVVLIAAGGITGDPQLVRAHWPPEVGPAPRELLVGAHRFGDGRMHRACQAVGGQVRHLGRMWNYAAGIRHWQPRQPDHGLSVVPPRSALWLDAGGQRFVPPLLAGWDTSEAVERIGTHGAISWQVMNRRIALRELAVSGAEFNPSVRKRRALAFARELLLGNRWLVDTLGANCPDVILADTPEQLAQRMNALQGTQGPVIDASALLKALRDFDDTVAGDDPQRQYIRAVRQWKGDRLRTAKPGRILDSSGGPLIAIRERIISRKTLGGIVTDLSGRVLDEQDRAVAGLYAAGEASGFGGGGMNGRRALEGTFLGGCIYSARRAAGVSLTSCRAWRRSGTTTGPARQTVPFFYGIRIMKKTGAWLARYALEQIGVRWTFGIPGVHNTELYDELNESETITPILVTHEGGGAFAADAVSRVSEGAAIGTLALVPAAGLTHAASGIGEAMLGGIPMLILTGGVRRDSNRSYQLHDIDQMAIAQAITKGAYRVLRQQDVVPTIFAAVHLALSGEPGPVLVELPLDVLLFPGPVDELPVWVAPERPAFSDERAIADAAARLLAADRPGIFVGWGGRAAAPALVRLAELLEAPVATTLQGQASFPHDHPLHVGFGFGRSSVPAARNAFAGCDCLLAVGTRFAEIATGSYGVDVPANLIHVDINPAVFNANYPAAVTLAGDASVIVEQLLQRCQGQQRLAPVTNRPTRSRAVAAQIAADKAAYVQTWLEHDCGGRVNPARFFTELRRQTASQAIVVVDDGNHTYLTAELFSIPAGGQLIVPTDFNAMGYAVPAAIGARLARPDRETIAIVGDGGFLMTCMEIVSAVTLELGLVYYVFCDGELAQIAQAQRLPYRRAPCSRIGSADLASLAAGVGAAYVRIADDAHLANGIAQARGLAAQNEVVIVEVSIAYSKATAFTQGTIKTNFRRFPLAQKARMLARMLRRSIGARRQPLSIGRFGAPRPSWLRISPEAQIRPFQPGLPLSTLPRPVIDAGVHRRLRLVAPARHKCRPSSVSVSVRTASGSSAGAKVASQRPSGVIRKKLVVWSSV